ncbi:hypothetical protein ASD65_17760 [Microbacterium sp. Root61]|uniref:hypothetical protein n=1 Tax=Microbacterium sp. Root61 TaxID=1736570 RepID=UPI0006F637CF|nr:hypothetical protein [Microbacterium sp. Root61]KRA22330.1 hypothetical protein ASD65_17760 [Microbacterium sp. Root61]
MTSDQQQDLDEHSRAGIRAGGWRRAGHWLHETAVRVSGRREGVAPIEPGTLGRVLVLWAGARALSLLLLWVAYQASRLGAWGFGPDRLPVTTFLNFLADWDAARYGRIADSGYPVSLPMNVAGVIQPNDWAFLPVFPALERGTAEVLGVSWQAAGVALSILASAGATVLLFVLLRRVTTPHSAWWAVVLFSVGPLSFVFVLAYAESLFLALVFACLLLAVDRRYAWIAPIGVVAAFTRPGAVALALGLALLFVVRWLRRAEDPFPLGQRIGLVASGLTLAVAGVAWAPIVEAVTGTTNAYVRTEMAWWVPFIGSAEFVPLTPWFRLAGTYLGVVGIAIVLAIAVAFVLWLRSRHVRRLGIEITAFAASYGLYIFAVFMPQQSIFRLLLPLSPLLADDRLHSSARRRRWVVGTAVGLQAVGVLLLWTIGWP